MSELDAALHEARKIISTPDAYAYQPFQPLILLKLMVGLIDELHRRDGQLVVKIAREIAKELDDRPR